MAEIHEFPRDGERLWRALESSLRTILQSLTGPVIVEQLLSRLAPTVRHIADRLKPPELSALSREDGVKEMNNYFAGFLQAMLVELATREIELTSLRFERNVLTAQLLELRDKVR
jgi:hypothetical protein